MFQESYEGTKNLNECVQDFYPDATLEAALVAAEAAGTPTFEEIYVKLVTSAAKTVTLAGNTDIPNGRIKNWKRDATYGYILSVSLFCYPDVEGLLVRCGNGGIWEMYYGANAVALGQQIQMAGAAGTTVAGVNTGGVGKVVGVDATNLYCDVLI